MIVYRLTKAAYAHSLSGLGAERYGGRWNSKGTPMLYTSGTRALCVVEVAVHIPLGILPKDYQLVTLELPDEAISHINPKALPKDWNRLPPAPSSQKWGDAFVRDGESLALNVPSAAVQGEYNVLINPLHPSISEVTIQSVEPFTFDLRLFGATK